ncbi:MAG: arylsulfotransferase family protein [Parvibaculum sp.]
MTYQHAGSDSVRTQSLPETAQEPKGGWIGPAAFVLSIALIAFLAGAWTVLSRVPPYKLLTNAHDAAGALYAQATQYGDRYQTDLWYDARSDDKGVVAHDAATALEGYTLYTSSHEPSAFLVDMKGREVHRWFIPPEKIWTEDVEAAGTLGPHIYIRKSYMYPNGDLLAVYEGSGDTPWGLGLVKLDRNSNVVWSYLDERAHHDVEVGADGTIYALTHEMRHEPVEGQGLETPLIEDFLVILSPDGKVEKRLSLLDVFAESRFKWLLSGLSRRTGQDPLHTNSVKEVGAEAGAAMNVAREGDLMISFRNVKLVAVLDPKTEELVWGTLGPWVGQHDAEPLANGNVLLFDNNGNYNGPGGSRVMEFAPETMEIVWAYEGTKVDPLKSVLRSASQRLPNGNTLITESQAGRLIEVTPEGKIAWEYVNPVRGGEGDKKIPIVAWGRRYAPADLDRSFEPKPEYASGEM